MLYHALLKHTEISHFYGRKCLADPLFVFPWIRSESEGSNTEIWLASYHQKPQTCQRWSLKTNRQLLLLYIRSDPDEHCRVCKDLHSTLDTGDPREILAQVVESCWQGSLARKQPENYAQLWAVGWGPNWRSSGWGEALQLMAQVETPSSES